MPGVAEGPGLEQELHVSRVQSLLTRAMPKTELRRFLKDSGGNSSRPSEGCGLPLARLACCALLPSVVLGGFASAAAAAGVGGAAAGLSPLLANRWWVTVGTYHCRFWVSTYLT